MEASSSSAASSSFKYTIGQLAEVDMGLNAAAAKSGAEKLGFVSDSQAAVLQVLQSKIAHGGSLSPEEKDSVQEMREAIDDIKVFRSGPQTLGNRARTLPRIQYLVGKSKKMVAP